MPSFPVVGVGQWENYGNLNILSAKPLKAVLKLCSLDSVFSSECSLNLFLSVRLHK